MLHRGFSDTESMLNTIWSSVPFPRSYQERDINVHTKWTFHTKITDVRNMYVTICARSGCEIGMDRKHARRTILCTF